jgi:phosphotransferase system enzyme I (PtsI)
MLRVHGTVASHGLALGPLYYLDDTALVSDNADIPDPRVALDAALAQAVLEISQLMDESADEDAKALLEFQIAMLEDETLLEPARKATSAGAEAARAWRDAIAAQLAQFEDAENPYFRARCADLEDMRDRVLRSLLGGGAHRIPKGSIVVARDLAPSLFLETDWEGGGIVLTGGSAKSHVAMLARSRGVPMLIGTPPWDVKGHIEALIDTELGQLVASPEVALREAMLLRLRRKAPDSDVSGGDGERVLLRPASMRSGESVKVMINIADARELTRIDPSHCDGIGLVRTELLLRTRADLLDETGQLAAYRAMIRWARGKPVTIRTLDAGSDKPIEGYTLNETNPFLGTRGVRLSLTSPAILATQLRALARAAHAGPLRVMVPMVTQPAELEAVRALMDDAIGELAARGIDHGRPELGMMVEVPAAAVTLDLFQAAFFSIGSNDLIQYLSAASRDLASLSALQEPLQPAVLRVVQAIVTEAGKRQIDVSLCGDMASEPRCVPALLAAGLRAFSVAPVALARVKTAIAAAP